MASFLFRLVLPMSLAGSLAYLLLLLVSPLLKKLGGRHKKTALLALCVLLVLPFPLLFYGTGAVKQTPALGQGNILQQAPPTAPVFQAGQMLGDALEHPVPLKEGGLKTNGVLTFQQLTTVMLKGVPVVYFGGLLVICFLFAWRYGQFIYHLSATLRHQEEEVNCLYRQVCTDYGVKKPPLLYESDAVSAPLLIGMHTPHIILPAGLTDIMEIQFALEHELTHYKKGDIYLKFFVWAVTALHWFNPLMIKLRKDFTEACEECCDDYVVERLSAKGRKAYSATLLSFAGPTPPGITFGFSSPAGRLKKRLVRVLYPLKPSRKLWTMGTGMLCLLLAGGVLAGCSLAAGMGEKTTGSSGGISEGLGFSQLQSSTSGLVSGIAGGVSSPVESQEGGSVVEPSQPRAVSATDTEGEKWMIHPVPNARFSSRGMGEGHRGRDFNAPVGTPIYSVGAGVVVNAGYHYSYGEYIVINHKNGISTLYAHCNLLLVEEGEEVEQGQQIAEVGTSGMTTGPNCHFEVQTCYETDGDVSMTEPDESTLPTEESGQLKDPDEYLPYILEVEQG